MNPDASPANPSAKSPAELGAFPAELDAAGFVDVHEHRGIRAFMAMAPAASEATEPKQVLDAYAEGIRAALTEPIALVTVSTVGVPQGQYRITRMLNEQGENAIPTDNPWEDKHKLPIKQGGLIGRILETAQPQLAVDLQVADDEALGDFFAPYRSMIAVPAFTGGKATHWNFQLRKRSNAFTPDHLAESIMRANMIGSAVHNVLVAKQLRELNERMEEQVNQIARIQKALLPKSLPVIRGVDLAVHYRPHDRAGGDMYDLVRLSPKGVNGEPTDQDRWAILVGDVSGHGTPATVVMAMLTAILYAYPRIPQGPAELLTYANRQLCVNPLEGTFVTAVIGIYEPATRRFTYARAGHPPILLKTPEGTQSLDAVGDLPLAVMDDTTYEEAAITLEPGQTLVMYTDGIIEEQDAQGQMFGVGGIKNALAHCDGEPRCVIHAINETLGWHRAEQPIADDQTIVAIRLDEDEA